MKSVTEITVEGGIGRVWESRPGKWRWAHPDGSEGIEDSFESAVSELEAIKPGLAPRVGGPQGSGQGVI